MPLPFLINDRTQLGRDLAALRQGVVGGRRQALRWLVAGATTAGAPALLAGCGGGDDTSSSTGASTGSTTGTTGTTGTTTGSTGSTGSTTGTTTGSTGSSTGSSGTSTSTSTCSSVPGETAGPYPGDGTNTANGSLVNVLTQSGVVRADIRSSFGGMSGTAAGVPLTVRLKLVNVANACANLSGLAVYAWHCTRDGNYSLYSSSVANQNYLRGVQVSDANGELSFTTIFPGCYSGRWPHIHFEVFRSLALATSGANDVLTSQLALPEAVCRTVYTGDSGYSSSVANLSAITLASDNVFGNDSAAVQMASVTGSVAAGYVATLTIGLSV